MAANTAGILNYRASGVQNTCRIFSSHLSGVQNTCRIFSHHPSVVQNTCRIGSLHPSVVPNTDPSRPRRPLRSPKNGHDIQAPPPPPSPFRGRLVGRMQYTPTHSDEHNRPEALGDVHFLSVRPSVDHCASVGTASVSKRPERRVARTRPEIRVSEAERSDASFSDFSVRSSSFSLGDRSLDLLLPPFLVSRQEKEVGAGGG